MKPVVQLWKDCYWGKNWGRSKQCDGINIFIN